METAIAVQTSLQPSPQELAKWQAIKNRLAPDSTGVHDQMLLGSVSLERNELLSIHARSLVEEVQREKAKQQKLEQAGNTTEPWYYLSGTGFFVHGQIDLFLKDIQQELQKGKAFQEAVDFCSVKVREDIRGFEDEYLKQLAGLKWNIGWKNVNGEQKLCGLDYNDAVLEDLTGKQEREGALFDAWFTDKPEGGKVGIESWLRTADVGSKALLVSPSGWSGFENFIYPQTQIYYVEVGEGKNIRSFTLRYDVPIEKNEELQKALGIPVVDTWNERDRIKQMLGNPIFVAPNGTPVRPDGTPVEGSTTEIHSPEDVIDLMQQIKKSPIAFSDPKFGDRTFDDMRAFINNPDKFLARHPQAQPLIDAFLEYASWEFAQGQSQEDTRQNLEIALALVVVHLKNLYFGSAGDTRRRSDSTVKTYNTSIGGVFQVGLNYHQELADIRTLPGCARTSETSTVRMSNLGTSQGAQLQSGEFCPKAVCKRCKHEVSDAEIAQGRCECGWAPGDPVEEPDTQKEKIDNTEKPDEKKQKKKEEPSSRPTPIKEVKKEQEIQSPKLPERRVSTIEAKAA